MIEIFSPVRRTFPRVGWVDRELHPGLDGVGRAEIPLVGHDLRDGESAIGIHFHHAAQQRLHVGWQMLGDGVLAWWDREERRERGRSKEVKEMEIECLGDTKAENQDRTSANAGVETVNVVVCEGVGASQNVPERDSGSPNVDFDACGRKKGRQESCRLESCARPDCAAIAFAFLTIELLSAVGDFGRLESRSTKTGGTGVAAGIAGRKTRPRGRQQTKVSSIKEIPAADCWLTCPKRRPRQSR